MGTKQNVITWGDVGALVGNMERTWHVHIKLELQLAMPDNQSETGFKLVLSAYRRDVKGKGTIMARVMGSYPRRGYRTLTGAFVNLIYELEGKVGNIRAAEQEARPIPLGL